MNAKQVISNMNLYSLSAFYLHDISVAANKLMQWDEKKWSTPPHFSTGANRPPLSKKELPLCLRLSEETRVAISLIHGYNINNENIAEATEKESVKKHAKGAWSGKGKKKLFSQEELVPLEKFIGTQTILYNYALLEEYEFFCFEIFLREKILDISDQKHTLKEYSSRGFDTLLNGAIEKELNTYERKGPQKRISEWEKYGIHKMSDAKLKVYCDLSSRRNELTHDSTAEPVTLQEALVLFHLSRLVVKEIAELFSDNSISDCNVPWDELPPLDESLFE